MKKGNLQLDILVDKVLYLFLRICYKMNEKLLCYKTEKGFLTFKSKEREQKIMCITK